MSKEVKESIWDYFDDNIEYPKNIVDNPIPYGEVWTYISSSFLNGVINYVKPISCYVLNRYTQESEDISSEKFTVCNKDEFGKWHNWVGTKKELIVAIQSGEKEVYHTNMRCFLDDIIILAKIENELESQNKYIFFWFDMDSSDCSIGKFMTDDSEEKIIENLEKGLKKDFVDDKVSHESYHEIDSSGFHKLPLSFIKGWVSF